MGFLKKVIPIILDFSSFFPLLICILFFDLLQLSNGKFPVPRTTIGIIFAVWSTFGLCWLLTRFLDRFGSRK